MNPTDFALRNMVVPEGGFPSPPSPPPFVKGDKVVFNDAALRLLATSNPTASQSVLRKMRGVIVAGVTDAVRGTVTVQWEGMTETVPVHTGKLRKVRSHRAALPYLAAIRFLLNNTSDELAEWLDAADEDDLGPTVEAMTVAEIYDREPDEVKGDLIRMRDSR